MTSESLGVRDARQAAAIGKQATLHGWVRTRRDSKGGFSFLELNDGSCLGNIQIIADGNLANYESDVKRLSPGCSVTVRGQSSGSSSCTDQFSGYRNRTPRC